MNRSTASVALLCLAFVVPANADEDALPIVKQAFEAAKANQAAMRQYVYRERVEEVRFDKKDGVKKRETHTWDVTLLDGSEYRRLVAINDKPLYSKTEAKEQRKLEKQLNKMRNETPRQRAKRMAKIEKGRKEGEKFLEEITKAFDFRLTGEEELDGVATHVISAEPKPGYVPKSREAKVLPKVRGTLWVAKDDHGWVKMDLEVFENVRWAVVFKLNKGAKIRFEQRKINDEVWITDNWYVRMKAKAALVFNFNGELTGTYTNFQRFTTDSKVIQGETRN